MHSIKAEEKLKNGNVSKVPLRLSAVELLVAGGCAGAVAKTVTAPLDRIKILYQVNPERPFTYGRAYKSFRTILRHSGWQGLWRGNGAALIRVIPYASISYMSFDRFERLFSEYVSKDKGAGSRFMSGAAAGATATTITYPLDLCRARMAAHWGTNPLYSSYIDAFRHIVRIEGARALWNGLTPTLIGIVPYAGIAFSVMETLKASYLKSHPELPSVPNAIHLIFGGAAGIIAQTSTYPLDTVRRRQQVSTPDGVVKYTSAMNTLRSIIVKEGLRGLYKGITMNWMKGPIASAVSFYVNDSLKGTMTKYRDGWIV
eukprot:m.16036 g.16036  ORF g.16036 m.16036 type:complete len:315 (-) comp5569_c0_seq2:35-979(-)